MLEKLMIYGCVVIANAQKNPQNDKKYHNVGYFGCLTKKLTH